MVPFGTMATVSRLPKNCPKFSQDGRLDPLGGLLPVPRFGCGLHCLRGRHGDLLGLKGFLHGEDGVSGILESGMYNWSRRVMDKWLKWQTSGFVLNTFTWWFILLKLVIQRYWIETVICHMLWVCIYILLMERLGLEFVQHICLIFESYMPTLHHINLGSNMLAQSFDPLLNLPMQRTCKQYFILIF